MSTDIRLAPSGPPILSDSGAPLDFGSGARLRLAEGTTTLGSTTNHVTTVPLVLGVQLVAVPVDPDTGSLIVELAAPDVLKNYKATVYCDVINTLTTANITVTLDIQTSPDGGATWGTIASNDHVLAFSTDVDGGARQIRLDATLRSGASFGIAADSTEIQVRARISGSVVGALVSHADGVTEAGDGSCYLGLEEMF